MRTGAEVSVKTMLRISVVALFLMIFVFPQSYMQLKLPFLTFAAIMISIEYARGVYKIYNSAFIAYYYIFGLITLVWCGVGLIKESPDIAVIESFRVYFIYMWVYFLLALFISNVKYHEHIDSIICIAAIGIGMTSAYVLADYAFGLGWLSQDVLDDMYLQIGVHTGYVQMNNVNIGMLTFIVPYLLSRVIIETDKPRHLLLICLAIALLSAILASRRIVLVVFMVTPIIAYAIGLAVGRNEVRTSTRVLNFYLVTIFSCVATYWAVSLFDPAISEGFVARVFDIFSKNVESERQLQHAALIEGFEGQYLWGSGFGGLTDIVRSDERPWTYELTYSRILFNSGVIGVLALAAFFTFFFLAAIWKIRSSCHKNIYVPLMVGLSAVLIASTSNPYLSSFDFVFVLSIIPLILNTREKAGGALKEFRRVCERV